MENWPVNAVDITLGVILLVSGTISLLRGFVHELLSIVAWIGAIFATLYGFPHLQPIARDVIPVALIADVGAGVLIFLLVLVGLSIVTRVLSGYVQESSLGALDRSLGMVYGLLRGFIVGCLLWLGIAWLAQEEPPIWLETAKTGPLLDWGGDLLVRLVPEDLLRDSAQAAEQAVENLENLENTGAFDQLNSGFAKDGESSEEGGYNEGLLDQMDGLIESLGSSSD